MRRRAVSHCSCSLHALHNMENQYTSLFTDKFQVVSSNGGPTLVWRTTCYSQAESTPLAAPPARWALTASAFNSTTPQWKAMTAGGGMRIGRYTRATRGVSD